jgi:hypothetical protein
MDDRQTDGQIPSLWQIECVHSDILRRIIVEQVATMMVLPNKLPIRLSDEIPATLLKVPEPEVSIQWW